ncbi:hypothetical protein Taro_047042 [Colocasia esculenta]|uniref:RING-type domain-containing protein n=1 Tax=Colocasia esculenta TaxID=4460 RepID=A0A843X4Y1_COLES|nr:hypothetical protein [Colocasia esculenta]
MRSSARFFQSSGYLPAEAPPPEPLVANSDILVTLAALLCALICVVGLALVARCAWLRRSSEGSPPAPPNKGLKKKTIRALPRVSFRPGAADAGGRLAECPICLAEFVEGDEIRVLPRCGHGFHAACVDLWLGSHSSCPSCRQFPVTGAGVPPGCRKCDPDASPAPAEAARVGPAPAPLETTTQAREAGDGHRFLP